MKGKDDEDDEDDEEGEMVSRKRLEKERAVAEKRLADVRNLHARRLFSLETELKRLREERAAEEAILSEEIHVDEIYIKARFFCALWTFESRITEWTQQCSLDVVLQYLQSMSQSTAASDRFQRMDDDDDGDGYNAVTSRQLAVAMLMYMQQLQTQLLYPPSPAGTANRGGDPSILRHVGNDDEDDASKRRKTMCRLYSHIQMCDNLVFMQELTQMLEPSATNTP